MTIETSNQAIEKMTAEMIANVRWWIQNGELDRESAIALVFSRSCAGPAVKARVRAGVQTAG